MSSVSVSVIVAAYNIEDYIERCLISIINQSFKDLEIIVVNDGSTDKTLEKIQKMADKDSRIIIIDKENGGVNSARNIGLRKAVGKYILFVDGDDWLEIDTIQKLYENITLKNLDILLYNAYESYDSGKKEMNTFLTDIGSDYLKELLLAKIMPCVWCKFIRKECIENIEFPINVEFGEDLVVVCDLFSRNLKIGTLSENLYNYYQRTDSVTKTISSKMLDLGKSFSIIENNLKSKNLYNTYNSELEFSIYNHIFIHRIIDTDYHNDITKKLYYIYKSKGINIHRNKYIYSVMKEGNIIFKLRKFIYDKSYTLGNMYDFFRRIIKIG